MDANQREYKSRRQLDDLAVNFVSLRDPVDLVVKFV